MSVYVEMDSYACPCCRPLHHGVRSEVPVAFIMLHLYADFHTHVCGMYRLHGMTARYDCAV